MLSVSPSRYLTNDTQPFSSTRAISMLLGAVGTPCDDSTSEMPEPTQPPPGSQIHCKWTYGFLRVNFDRRKSMSSPTP